PLACTPPPPDAPASASDRASFASVARVCAPASSLLLSSNPSMPERYTVRPATTPLLRGRLIGPARTRRADEDAVKVISTEYCGPTRSAHTVARAGGCDGK